MNSWYNICMPEKIPNSGRKAPEVQQLNFKGMRDLIMAGKCTRDEIRTNASLTLEEQVSLGDLLAERLEWEQVRLKEENAELQKEVHSNKEEISHLREMVGRDALVTDALNREYMTDILESVIRELKHQGEKRRSPKLKAAVLVYIDINKFKEINDRYGHSVGDQALIILGRRIAETIRPRDHLFRPGGDEFLIVLPVYEPANGEGIDEAVDPKALYENIIRNLRSNLFVDVEEERIPISLSTGVDVLDSTSPLTAEEVIKKAEQKMYKEKRGETQ